MGAAAGSRSKSQSIAPAEQAAVMIVTGLEMGRRMEPLATRGRHIDGCNPFPSSLPALAANATPSNRRLMTGTSLRGQQAEQSYLEQEPKRPESQAGRSCPGPLFIRSGFRAASTTLTWKS